MSQTTTNPNSATTSDQYTFTLIRTFDAPRELVFKAWADAEQLAQWWGPKGCQLEICGLDFRPQGVFHYFMKMPDGTDLWGRLVYQEIEAPERLVFIDSFADAQGHIIRAPFAPEFPLEIHSTLNFTERDGQTTLHISNNPHNATVAEQTFFKNIHQSMQGGWNGMFDKLTEHLAQG